MPAMLKIGLKKKPKSDSNSLVVNGSIDKDSFVFKSAKGLLFAHLYNHKTAGILTSMCIRDLQQHFAGLTVPYEVEWNTHFYEAKVDLFSYHGKKEHRIRLELHPDFEQWAKPYSIAEYAEAIEQAAKSLAIPQVRYYEADELISNGFGIRCRISAGNPVLDDEIKRCAEALKRVCEAAEKLLAATARKNSVTTFFIFPPGVRTACE